MFVCCNIHGVLLEQRLSCAYSVLQRGARTLARKRKKAKTAKDICFARSDLLEDEKVPSLLVCLSSVTSSQSSYQNPVSQLKLTWLSTGRHNPTLLSKQRAALMKRVTLWTYEDFTRRLCGCVFVTASRV